ncbi:MAG: hypothetical protein H7066_09120 [Cytophagaceae bacterium]|nr:hypothetical protein [Gemmatimonadaceae bacterium]
MTESVTGDSLQFTVRVPESVHVGERVRVRLRLANVGAQAIELHLQGLETVFDVVVLDDTGAEVWRRSDGTHALAVPQLRPLAAGDSIEFVATWHQADRTGHQVTTGAYAVIGELPGDGLTPMRSAPAPLQVTAARVAAPLG